MVTTLVLPAPYETALPLPAVEPETGTDAPRLPTAPPLEPELLGPLLFEPELLPEEPLLPELPDLPDPDDPLLPPPPPPLPPPPFLRSRRFVLESDIPGTNMLMGRMCAAARARASSREAYERVNGSARQRVNSRKWQYEERAVRRM